LQRASKAGVCVPAILWTDAAKGLLAMERIPGQTVKERLRESSLNVEQLGTSIRSRDTSQRLIFRVLAWLAERVGEACAKLHSANIIHGDLTTSNMMLSARTDKMELVVLIEWIWMLTHHAGPH
jgi:TP53 regulating kinase-like protein